jgi:Domain of unknown function (DUF4397)
MKSRRLTLLIVILTLLVSGLSMSAPAPTLAAEAGVAYVRAVHASPDAPAVDVYVDGAKAISSLAFGKTTDWLPLAAGKAYSVALRAAGAAADSAPVFEKAYTLSKDSSVMLVALGMLNPSPLGTEKPFDLKAYAINRLDPKSSGRIDVIHTVPDGPAVDIVVGGRAAIRTLTFGRKNLVPLEAEAGTLDIQVTEENKADSVLLDASGFRVQAGKIYTILAIGKVDDIAALVVQSDPYVAFVRIVHAAPDAPGVDVYIDGQFAYGTLYFGGFTRFVRITAGPHDVALRGGGASASSEPVFEVKGVNFDINSSTTVVAQGLLSGEGAQAFTLGLYNTNREPTGGKARIYLIHASPDAPTVDIYAGGARPAVRNLRFGKGNTVPLDVDAGRYDVKVTPNGQADTIVIDAPGVRLAPDTIYTILAIGKLDKIKALVLSAPVYNPLAP